MSFEPPLDSGPNWLIQSVVPVVSETYVVFLAKVIALAQVCADASELRLDIPTATASRHCLIVGLPSNGRAIVFHMRTSGHHQRRACGEMSCNSFAARSWSS